MTIDTEFSKRHEEPALSFRAAFEELVRRHTLDSDPVAWGENAALPLEVCFARGRSSQHWFTVAVNWHVLLALLGTELEETDKDGVIFCAGPLKDGKTEHGTRKLKENVEGLDLVVLDFDKGDAPLDKLEVRLKELGLEGAAYATFSHLKAETGLAWSVTRPNPKTGETETVPTAFQNFVRARAVIDEPSSPRRSRRRSSKPTWSRSRASTPVILGDVTVARAVKIEKTRFKAKDGNWQTQETCNVVAKHNPLAKSRLVLPLATRFARRPEESKDAFQKRWQQEVYHPVARLIGFRFDPTCASVERGHYAMTRRAGQESVPLCHTRGRLIDLEDAEIKNLLAPFGDDNFRNSRQRSAFATHCRSA